MSNKETFEFPKIYHFPPLYTKQPNQTVLNQQLESWTSIILQYCEFYKITSLTSDGTPRHSQISSANSFTSIFRNESINRSCNLEFIHVIMRHLIHLKKGDYINPKKPELGVYIYWRSLVSWSDLIYQYVDRTGQKGSILTIYELTKPDDVNETQDTSEEGLSPNELINLDELFLIKIIKDVLVKQGKVQLLINDDNEIGGVKIV